MNSLKLYEGMDELKSVETPSSMPIMRKAQVLKSTVLVETVTYNACKYRIAVSHFALGSNA